MYIPFNQPFNIAGAPFAIYRLEGYISNIFIIEYQDGLILLDSGAACDAGKIEHFCRHNLHRSPDAIKLAFISHIHPDHAGGLQFLRQRYHIKVAAHRNIDLWYAGMGGFIQQQIDSVLMFSVARRNNKRLARIGYGRTIKPDYILEDNAALPFFNDWTVFFVPGHTLHDIVVYNSKSRVLYAGDCICNVNGRFLAPLPIMFMETMKQSYEKLAALNIETILLAHGEPLHAPATENVFSYMKELLDEPPNLMRKKIYLLSLCSPEIWRNKKLYK